MRRLLVAFFRTLVTVAVVVVGILGIRSATYQGQVIAGRELDTAVATNQLTQKMDAAYGAGQDALRAADPATRSRLFGTLYTSLLPAMDAQLLSLRAAARRRLAGRTRRPRAFHPAVGRRP